MENKERTLELFNVARRYFQGVVIFIAIAGFAHSFSEFLKIKDSVDVSVYDKIFLWLYSLIFYIALTFFLFSSVIRLEGLELLNVSKYNWKQKFSYI